MGIGGTSRDLPGLVSVDMRVGPSVVLLATSGRIAMHPDFAEQLAIDLMRRAAIARALIARSVVLPDEGG